jgi:hypothetical protein
VLNTMKISLYVPATGTSAKSPIVTDSLLAARLGAELGDHRRREVDAVHPGASGREGQGDTSGADHELQSGTAAGQFAQERSRGRLVAARLGVVDVRGLLAEAVHRPVALHGPGDVTHRRCAQRVFRQRRNRRKVARHPCSWPRTAPAGNVAVCRLM